MNDTKPTPASGPCTRCSVETSHRFGGFFICESCYEIRGACCTEFEPEEKD